MSTSTAPASSTQRAPLSSAARRVIVANTLSALGNGFTLPFLLIYLHQVRGLPLALAGAAVAAMNLVGLVSGPVAGHLIDSLGPRRMLLAALTAATVGSLLLAEIHSVWQTFLAALVMGVAGSSLWSATTSLVAATTTPEQRQRAFALEFQLLNAGIGVGGICGGWLADVHHPSSFVLLYVIDACSYALCGLVVLSLRGAGGPQAVPDEKGQTTTGGYRDVLRDKVFLRYCALTFLAASCGYIQLDSAFPVFALQDAKVSTHVIGIAFAVNTAVIVVAQMLVLRFLVGRRRTNVLALVGLVWASAWLVAGAAGLVPATVTASVLVAVSVGVFAMGETLWQPTGSTLVNELAPAHLRGRYNALGVLMWASAGVIGPPVAGWLLGAGLSGWWVALIVTGLLGYAAGARRLSHHLTDQQDGVGAAPPSQPPPSPGTAVAAEPGAAGR